MRERRLADLIPAPLTGGVLEASGVVARGRDCFVIFDNVRRVARIDRSLAPDSARHMWLGPRRYGEGYEDIAYSPHLKRFYLLIEAEKHPDGTFKAVIEECGDEFRRPARRWVGVAFDKRNTGFEGLSAVHWQGSDYLLALCEGNRCKAGRKGRTPGGGRIHVLRRRATRWEPWRVSSCPNR